MGKNALLFVSVLLGHILLHGSNGYICSETEVKRRSLCESLPEGSCGWDVSVGILIEQMRTTNSAVLAIEEQNEEQTTTQSGEDYKIAYLDFDMDTGISVSLGRFFDHCSWMFKARFEWLHSIGNFEVETHDTTYLFPLSRPRIYYSTNTVFPMLLTQAKASLDINYYMLDLFLNSGHYFSQDFSYTRFAGVKVGWIDCRGSDRFMNDVETTLPMPANQSWLAIERVNFWGVGPMIGLDSIYRWYRGWGVFSGGNIAALLGQNHYYSTVGFDGTRGYVLHYRNAFSSDAFCSTIRANIGVQYEQEFFNKAQLVCIRIGFDGRYYVNPLLTVDEFSNYTPTTSSSIIFSGAQQVNYTSFGMFGLILEANWSF